METTQKRRRVVVDDSQLAAAIGERIKRARLAAGLTQAALAGDRYTKAYISALEHGIAKPSMAALNYLAPRLGTTGAALLADTDPTLDRLAADLRLATGDWQAALDGYEQAVDRTSDRIARAEIRAGIAQCLCRLDRPREAILPATQAAEALIASQRPAEAMTAEYWLASAHYQAASFDEARSIVTRLIDRVRAGAVVAPDFRMRLLVAAAMIERSAGAPAVALAYLEEAKGLSVDIDDRRRGSFLATMADAHREAGDDEAAIRYGLQALALLRAVEADLELGHLENQLALSYLAAGNTQRAGELAHHARLTAVARHEGNLAAALAETEARIALAAGDPEAAIDLADEALWLADDHGDHKARADALTTRGRARASVGQHDLAAADFEAAAASASDPGRRREVLSAWADSLAALGRHDRAFALAREALDQR